MPTPKVRATSAWATLVAWPRRSSCVGPRSRCSCIYGASGPTLLQAALGEKYLAYAKSEAGQFALDPCQMASVHTFERWSLRWPLLTPAPYVACSGLGRN